jgi:hypothetical protein
VLLFLPLLFASCPWGEDFTAPNKNREIPVPVDLTPLMPGPVAGSTPVFSFSQTAYAGTVKWWQEEKEPKPEATETAGAETQQEEELVPEDTKPGEIFQPETVYKARVTLIPMTGHYFPPGLVMIQHTAPEVEELSSEVLTDRTWTVELLFSKTGRIVVSDLDLTSKIPMPVSGTKPQMPQGEGQEELQYYIKTIDWWNEKDSASVKREDTFLSGKEYTAEVFLEAKPGYTFTRALEGQFFHRDAYRPRMKDVPPREGNELTLIIDFPSITP